MKKNTPPEKNEAVSRKEAALVPVTKDGETIRVCPAQVEQHARLGWTVVKKK